VSSAAPTARWHDVRASFHDFAITSFAVDPGRLRALLPDDCAPEIVSLRDGRERGLVSAVSFHARHFRLHAVPWPSASFMQVNYRTYVRHQGEPAVWFFGTAVAAPWHLAPRLLWRLPWRRARIEIEATWDGDHCRRYELRQRSAAGGADLVAKESDRPIALDGFSDDDEGRRLLTDPLVGYCRRGDGRRAAYRVWHPRLEAHQGAAETAHFQVFENLGLVARGDAPHSVLLQRETEFLVRLPPEG
jgi:Uncharacterized conserved protein (COG2071)